MRYCSPLRATPRDTAYRHHVKRIYGFTYLGVVILVATISLVSTAGIHVGLILHRRAAEEELLAIGAEFRSALISYARATPDGQSRAPRALQDLLKDPRYPTPRRHLRRLYADPITNQEQWGLVEAADGSGIIGVHSLSDAHPIKLSNFETVFADFAGKASYRDWKFMVDPLPRAPATRGSSSEPRTGGA